MSFPKPILYEIKVIGISNGEFSYVCCRLSNSYLVGWGLTQKKSIDNLNCSSMLLVFQAEKKNNNFKDAQCFSSVSRQVMNQAYSSAEAADSTNRTSSTLSVTHIP